MQVKIKVKISQNFVAFSEYMNFKASIFKEGCVLEFILQVLARCVFERQAKYYLKVGQIISDQICVVLDFTKIQQNYCQDFWHSL